MFPGGSPKLKLIDRRDYGYECESRRKWAVRITAKRCAAEDVLLRTFLFFRGGFVCFQDKARFVFRYAPGADRKFNMPTIRYPFSSMC